MNKKAIFPQVKTVAIMGLVLLGIVIFIFFMGLILPPVVNIASEMMSILKNTTEKTEIKDIDNSTMKNMSDATFGTTKKILSQFNILVFILLILLLLTFIFLAFFVRTYPFLIFFWIFIIIALVVISLFLSNAYIKATKENSLSEFYTSWKNTHYLIIYLPHLVAGVGIIGGIIMFMLATKDTEAEVAPI